MEGLIIVIVISIISALFGKNSKKEQPEKQMPSFGQQKNPEKSNPGQNHQKPVAKSLEDFANEIFGQLNEKKEQVKPKVERKRPVMQKPKAVVIQPEAEVQRVNTSIESNRSNRPPLAERPVSVKVKALEKTANFVPKSRQDLIQGIVMAEILGPPKAKRK